MEEKEKQIEEMAKEIEKAKQNIWAGVRTRAEDEDYLWHSRAIAEELYNADYRKIPEGSVVLSKEELNKKYVPVAMYDLAKAFHDKKCAEFEKLCYDYEKLNQRLKDAQEFWKASYRTEQEARKETAKEIFNALMVLIKRSNLELAILDKNDIQESAKDYGIIIE